MEHEQNGAEYREGYMYHICSTKTYLHIALIPRVDRGKK